MSRTPLFRTLRRALQVARALEEYPDRSAVDLVSRLDPKWTRRALLKTTAVTAAGAALGCRGLTPRSASPASGGQQVVVIGAGIAGLTCAHRLTQAGVSVRIFEAQKRVGGRMWSLRDHFPAGQVCELGGELVDSNHLALRGLCTELGLELDDFDADDPSLARDVWAFEGRRIKDEEIVAAFRPIARQIDEAWASLSGDMVSYREPNGGESIDRLSIAEWLDSVGCDGWFRRLLEVGYVTEYGLEIDQQSAWNLLMLIDSEPDPFRIFGDSDERFHIRGGNDLVPTRLAERLEGKIELDSRLEALAQASDGSYLVTLRQGASSREVRADRVVLTLPFSVLREVDVTVPLPTVKRRAISELGYGTNAKLMVGFSERIWRTEGGSNGSVLSDLPFQLAWESTRLQAGQPGIIVGYTGGRRGLEVGQGSEAEQAQLFARAFAQVFPGAETLVTEQVRFHWPSFPWTRGSYSCYLPGQWTAFGGAEGERVDNLHFAGEHTSVDFQGYMEGGCESGERAAAEILADLGLARRDAA
jgi:monoamine oxidase